MSVCSFDIRVGSTLYESHVDHVLVGHLLLEQTRAALTLHVGGSPNFFQRATIVNRR